MYEFGIEESKSNRTCCSFCGTKFIKNGKRVYRMRPTKYGHRPTYYCLECSKEILLDARENIEKTLIHIQVELKILNTTKEIKHESNTISH